MAGRLFNLAKMNTATTGTGTITLSTAASGFLTFAQAGVTNGLSITYIIEDGANRELGVGTYTSSGTTLTRSVIKSTNSDAAINLSGSATVGITAAAENFAEWNATVDANGFNIGFDDNTGINDDSGNETVRFRKTSSAVNYIEVLNTETAVGPRIAAAGDDTNIDLRLAAKGTGRVQIPNATLTTPVLGTPSSGTLTNCTGLPASGVLGIREVLAANRTYFVRTDGNDSNDGLTNTSGGAFLTITKALNVAAALDLSIYSVTINVADGTYSESLSLKPYIGAGPIYLVGNATTPGNVILSPSSALAAINADSRGGLYDVSGFTVAPAVLGFGIYCAPGSYIYYKNIKFEAVTASYSHVYVNTLANANQTGNVSINGGSGLAHILVDLGGQYYSASRTFTFTANGSWSQGFAVARRLGGLVAISNTYTTGGFSTTGPRYLADQNGVISTSGATLPGSTAGSTATGGQYT